ncbi:alcohol dehydrogenase catalytic domain-containing protein [Nocardioides sp.]|uniref:alcohol dehydrogenase catalytic domain-containing protein n=1 Tax=Nocardioides sp. TaxID=35761 RepID=UPI0026166832|nr:alcohol dehydrogenase catalytic domain-containing protein [Nocardioides sp.]
MKAVRVHAPYDARLDDVPAPQLAAPDDVKVRVTAAGICGTDLWLYEHAPVPAGYRHPAFGETGPHVLGHELAGVVTEVGPAAAGPTIGDLVAVRPLVACGTCATCRRGDTNICEQRGFLGIHGGGGGFSEQVVVPVAQVHVLPEPFTPATGALVETLATCWHAVASVQLDPDDPVLVIGAGPIGLGVVLCLRAHGVRDVLVSAHGEARQQAARSFGAQVVDPRETDLVRWVRTTTSRAGVAVSFDCAGAPGRVVDEQVKVLRPGGHLVVVAEFHEPTAIDLASLMRAGKHLHGSSAYTPADFDAVIAAVAAGDLDPTSLVTSVVTLEDAISAGLDGLRDGARETQVKILVGQGTAS